MKAKAKIIIPIILVIAAIVAAVIIIYRPKKNEDGGSSTSTGTNNGQNVGTSTSTSDFPLKKGSRGEKVKFIQKYINKLAGIDLLTVDGIWGNATEAFARQELTRAYADRQITLNEYNRLVRIWNFCGKNGLRLSDFEKYYIYDDSTGTIHLANSGMANSGSNNSSYQLGESYLGIGII